MNQHSLAFIRLGLVHIRDDMISWRKLSPILRIYFIRLFNRHHEWDRENHAYGVSLLSHAVGPRTERSFARLIHKGQWSSSQEDEGESVDTRSYHMTNWKLIENDQNTLGLTLDHAKMNSRCTREALHARFIHCGWTAVSSVSFIYYAAFFIGWTRSGLSGTFSYRLLIRLCL